MNDFYFLEIPEKKIALFYSYDKTYENVFDARDAAFGGRSKKIINKRFVNVSYSLLFVHVNIGF